MNIRDLPVDPPFEVVFRKDEVPLLLSIFKDTLALCRFPSDSSERIQAWCDMLHFRLFPGKAGLTQCQVSPIKN